MADSRLLHKRGSHGERVIALDHLEYRVWVQYVLSADDYGVMRASASVLRADNPRLEREPLKRIEKALQTVVESGLIQTFTHQGVSFFWQTDWQDFQQVRYPRETVMPAPNSVLLETATPATQRLFALRSRTPRERLRNDFGAVTETSPIPARAGGRETLTLTPTPSSGSRSSEEIPISTVPPAWRAGPRRPQPEDRDLDYHRRNCPMWGSMACDNGVCIPKYLWPQWEKRQTPEVLRAFVEAWAQKGSKEGDKVEEFWPEAFKQHFGAGTVPLGKADKVGGAQRAVTGAIAILRGQKALVTDGRH